MPMLRGTLGVAALAIGVAAACSSPSRSAAPPAAGASPDAAAPAKAAKAHAFRGKVERIDTPTRSVMVAGARKPLRPERSTIMFKIFLARRGP